MLSSLNYIEIRAFPIFTKSFPLKTNISWHRQKKSYRHQETTRHKNHKLDTYLTLSRLKSFSFTTRQFVKDNLSDGHFITFIRTILSAGKSNLFTKFQLPKGRPPSFFPVISALFDRDSFQYQKTFGQQWISSTRLLLCYFHKICQSMFTSG